MICVFNIGNENFSGNGDAVLTPTSGKIRQAAGGNYDITLEHPIDPEGKWRHLVPGAIVRVPVPTETIPNAYAGMEADVYRVTGKTDMREGPSEPSSISYPTWSQYNTYSVGSKVTQDNKNYKCIYWDGNSTYRAVSPAGSSWWESIPNRTGGSAAVMTLNTGTELYFIEDYDGTWYKMSTTYGLLGYVKAAYVTFDRHLSPSETKPRVITEQLFRLKEPTVNTENQTVSVTGQHVSYDLSGVLVQDISISQASPAMAISRMTDAFMMDYRGTIATNLTDTDNGTYTEEFHGKNAIYALMDPDKGIVSSFDAKLTRDNWDLFVMKKDANPETACTFRYGGNMRGVTWKRSSSELVTRVVPVAKDAGGADLYLPEVYIDSSRINDYPVVMMERLSVRGQVGKETESGSGTTWTEETLLDEMRAKAAERFSVDKADQVRSEITIQFEQLGNTAEYAWLKPLESVLLYDTVKVIEDRIGLESTLEVTELEYDVIKKKLTGVKLSNMDSVEGRSVTGYNVHNNSIAKEKLMDGVVDDIVQQAVDQMPEFADPNAARPSSYTLPLAANGTRGGVQIGYSESDKNYAVKLSSEKMYVTVPWTNTWRNILIQEFSYTYTVAANGSVNITATNLSYRIPNGYTAAAIVSFDTNNAYVVVSKILIYTTNANIVRLKNTDASSKTADFVMRVLFMTTSM